MGKDSFILYDNYDEQFDFLTDEQAGVLIKALFAYRHGKTLPEMDGAVKMAFSFIRSQINRDSERYDDICESRKNAGRAGAAKRWGNHDNMANDSKNSKCYQMVTNDSKNSKRKQTMANVADNDNDYDYENDIKEKDNNKLLSKKKGFIPPTFDDVQAYAEQRGREDLAKPFFDFFTEGDWCDSNGTPVKSWKQKFITWETHNEKKEPPPTRSTYRKKVEFWQGD